MTLAPDREQALRNALPNNYHASIPALAQVLAAVLDGRDVGVVSPEMLGILRLYLFPMFMSNVRISL
jgi:hypothetical protein